ncbi:MAG: hypothetical protein M2R45_04622 [Verrucomicrobia subdivision 3 bacterium]|nr:hypothetical protein [Limisphaerales bacterium]MCS1417315.1 hypothetical protein [Limisphaerales bacterium]
MVNHGIERSGLRSSWVHLISLCLAVLFFGTGCESARFYAQAISGQVELLSRRKSLKRLIRDEATPLVLKERLMLVDRLVAFAHAELGLPDGGSYSSYVALDRPYVAWNVAVSPEFDLAPKTWWYPIVGRLEHRGYFRKASADQFAQRMKRRGYDVAVGGVIAYSTLGWFRDPVLSTFVELEETELAELIFHELAHELLFVDGDTDFNEAFAVTVAELGVRRWLLCQGDKEALRTYAAQLASRQVFMGLVHSLRCDLEAFYLGVAAENRESEDKLEYLRSQKEAIIGEFRQVYRAEVALDARLAVYEGWIESPINNAKVNVVDTYYRLIPFFRMMLDEQRSLEGFYRAVKEIGKRSKTERQKRLGIKTVAESGELLEDAG